MQFVCDVTAELVVSVAASFVEPSREMFRGHTVHHRYFISRRHKVHGLFTYCRFIIVSRSVKVSK